MKSPSSSLVCLSSKTPLTDRANEDWSNPSDDCRSDSVPAKSPLIAGAPLTSSLGGGMCMSEFTSWPLRGPANATRDPTVAIISVIDLPMGASLKRNGHGGGGDQPDSVPAVSGEVGNAD